MINLTNVAPVLDDQIDPRLAAAIHRAPPDVHVIFAGPDAAFVDALRRVYGLPLPCRDVLVCTKGSRLIITVAVQADADGLLLEISDSEDGTLSVRPAVLFTVNRVAGARRRLRSDDDHANLAIAALDDLLFRRVIPAERVS